jgi:hypothetical protein
MRLFRSFEYEYDAKYSIDYFSKTKKLQVLKLYSKTYSLKEMNTIVIVFNDTVDVQNCF